MVQLILETFSKFKFFQCDDCIKTCDSDEQDCFVIDNNGYIVIAENRNDTGKFFGQVEGAIMESMVESGIYKELTVYDLQGLCFDTIKISSDCSTFMTVII